MMRTILADTVDNALGGDVRSLARLASRIEAAGPAADALIERFYRLTGHGHVIGITGPPGAGKSSLVNRLTGLYRSRNQRVAILAVDPSSPYSGGATLGDRIRMLDFHDDPGVFVRSMASRGRPGGLATATAGVIHLFDAAGFDPILVETVGVGQGEADIAELTHTTVVVQSPGAGDDIQALKAGVLEVASILAVNKADNPGASTLQRLLKAMLMEGRESSEDVREWEPPVVLASANTQGGANALLEAIDQHRSFLQSGSRWTAVNRHRAASEIRSRVRSELHDEIDKMLSSFAAEAMGDTANRSIAPAAASDLLISTIWKQLAASSPGPGTGSYSVGDKGCGCPSSDTVVDVDDNKTRDAGLEH